MLFRIWLHQWLGKSLYSVLALIYTSYFQASRSGKKSVSYLNNHNNYKKGKIFSWIEYLHFKYLKVCGEIYWEPLYDLWEITFYDLQSAESFRSLWNVLQMGTLQIFLNLLKIFTAHIMPYKWDLLRSYEFYWLAYWQGLENINCYPYRGVRPPSTKRKKEKDVLIMTLNCIWWWGSSSGHLGSVPLLLGPLWPWIGSTC